MFLHPRLLDVQRGCIIEISDVLFVQCYLRFFQHFWLSFFILATTEKDLWDLDRFQSEP